MDTTGFSSNLTAAYLLVVLALAALAWRWTAVRGTTLVGPWSWGIASLAAIPFGGDAGDALRLVASSLTLCPAMSLLGAKRPQAKPWHFIVASLWLILSLPGIQALLISKSRSLETPAAHAWFLAILLAFGVVNSLFGRYWLCVLLAGLGQLNLLSPFLPGPLNALSAWDTSWGLICYASGVLLATVIPRRRRPSLNTLWREFRDAFGLVWTLRVMERLQATAQANGWDVAVGWSGFQSLDGKRQVGELSPEQLRAFRQNLSNLLRRFVSEDWISHRLGDLK